MIDFLFYAIYWHEKTVESAKPPPKIKPLKKPANKTPIPQIPILIDSEAASFTQPLYRKKRQRF